MNGVDTGPLETNWINRKISFFGILWMGNILEFNYLKQPVPFSHSSYWEILNLGRISDFEQFVDPAGAFVLLLIFYRPLCCSVIKMIWFAGAGPCCRHLSDHKRVRTWKQTGMKKIVWWIPYNISEWHIIW